MDSIKIKKHFEAFLPHSYLSPTSHLLQPFPSKICLLPVAWRQEMATGSPAVTCP